MGNYSLASVVQDDGLSGIELQIAGSTGILGEVTFLTVKEALALSEDLASTAKLVEDELRTKRDYPVNASPQ